MPLYEYQCKCGQRTDYFSLVKDVKPRRIIFCINCQRNTLQKMVFSPTPAIFKGNGFYGNDYRKAKQINEVADKLYKRGQDEKD